MKMSCQYFDFIPKSSSGLNTRFQASVFVLKYALAVLLSSFIDALGKLGEYSRS